jgi:2-polyprenyl-3-methyl-5-hydroxy-6-metoxy-1,4-benzoquinol methylase
MRESGDVHDKSIVDIGCGSGIYSIELARRGAGRVLGLDFSAPMLELARRSARDASVTTAEFVQDEFLAHDFKGETFDVSIAMGVFDYLSEPAPYLAKMAKITHGKILASFPASSLVRGTARRLRYRLTGRGDVYYYTRERVEDLVRRSGIKHHRFVTVSSSGGGLILVGDQS